MSKPDKPGLFAQLIKILRSRVKNIKPQDTQAIFDALKATSHMKYLEQPAQEKMKENYPFEYEKLTSSMPLPSEKNPRSFGLFLEGGTHLLHVLEKHADGRISFVKNYTIGTAKNGYGNE
jgi:hypothetical protein